MQHFAELYKTLDQTTKTNEKVDALCQYFLQANELDKIWVLAILCDRKFKSIAKTSELKLWAAQLAEIPQWLFDETYQIVGDLAETISNILPLSKTVIEKPLHVWIDEMVQLKGAEEPLRKEFICNTWLQLDVNQRFVFNKLCTGGFRIGVSQKLVVKALAKAFNITENAFAHRLMGNWDAQHTTFNELLFTQNNSDDLSKPYPFYLAYALDDELNNLGLANNWQAEYKWDGIRSQLIVRNNQIYIWSRGEELVTNKFPELLSLVHNLPNGTVIDGELVGYKNNKILNFNDLQTRITRKNVSKKYLTDVPVAIIAYDLLELDGKDYRQQPLAERRLRLAEIVQAASNDYLKISPTIEFNNWEELTAIRANARQLMAEGLMLKNKTSVYQVGRKKGDWYKWKLEPYTVDAVLIYAQKGHGRRANLYTDYTFAIWNNEGELVPFTKAYSGLTDKELVAVDAWIKQNTREKFGPVRSVNAELVFELGFEGINYSSRHKSGIALRFPRILRWRTDKKKEDADKLSELVKLIEV